MIDTHAHINSKDLPNLKDEIRKINRLDYLNAVINVGLDYSTNLEVLDIAEKNEKFYAALGIHPLHPGHVQSIFKLSETRDFSKVVALGETGLDYTVLTDLQKQFQREKFIETIALANYLRLPVIVHANRANTECLQTIKEHRPEYGFVFHCFEPDLEVLKEIMSLDGYISVGTPITKKNASKSIEVIKAVDMNNLLIELDYPYMIRDKDNDGKNVFNRIKEVRNFTHDELEYILDNNAKRLFRKLK